LMNTHDQFLAAMRQAGLEYTGPIFASGKIIRFRSSEDKTKNSWYVLFPGPPMAGAFGCWKRGIKQDWCEREPKQMSQAEWSQVRQHLQEAKIERERAEAERQEKARKVATWILKRAIAAHSHPYLEKKGAKAFGEMLLYRAALVVPLRDSSGELHSLQFIGADGTKRFLSGGKIAGCLYSLDDNPVGPLVICEGYATGASIHEATHYAVVCAMNCGNLMAVATGLRAKWPQRDIIIAADDDQWNPGNPGMAKAAEAAKTIRARLASPQFTDNTTKPTDFNDLQQLDGLAIVKKQIEAAAVQQEKETETYQRLAKISEPDYDRCRQQEAEAMGIRVGTLDSEVKKLRGGTGSGKLQGTSLELAEVEPWPHAVNGEEVLTAVSANIARYVALPPCADDMMALWIAHAHASDAFEVTPRLNITAPEKGCGKTIARDVVALFVPRPLSSENLTPAVLFRVIEERKPTILADEYDTWMRDNEELRGMFNAGHRRGGQALRCVGDGNEVRAFRVFAPAVLCGIGPLPGTLYDRSIVIHLRRAKPGEIRQRFDSRRVEPEKELCRKLARWMQDNFKKLEESDPRLPEAAYNRLADNWRPLFAIAEVAGGDWPRRAANAFSKLTTAGDAEAQGIGTMLLADIRQVLGESKAARILSRSLVESLCAMTEREWQEANRGKPITEGWLARRLRPFEISPKTLRIGTDRAKGYEAADFAEAFARYLPAEGLSNRDTVTNPINTGVLATFQSVTAPNTVTVPETKKTLANRELSRCHASDPPAGGKERELIEELI
jgi:putative DNA primase/helicase